MGTIAKHKKSPEESAQAMGLRYVQDQEPGFTRKRSGKSFFYLGAKSKKITDLNTLARIKSLVIPPAWEEVWICSSAKGHLQVTGKDARGRKQYRYHAAWTAHRNENKFQNLKEISRLLPSLRERVEKDLRKRGQPKEKIVAAVVKLLELTQVRVGNDEYAATNKSYGLTTIRNKHAVISGNKVQLKFKGKSGVEHDVCLRDPRLSRIVKECKDLPGEELFEYVGADGKVHDITSSDVNLYLKEATGGEMTAKELRTWSGSVKALTILRDAGPCEAETMKARKARELLVIRETAEHLRNTVAVCRKYYVHPIVFEADRAGKLHQICRSVKSGSRAQGLSAEERALVKLFS